MDDLPTSLDVERDGHVVTIRLNRPETLNALDAEMTAGLIRLLEALDHDDGCRAIVLTGAGRGFCAGADVASLAEAAGGDLRPPAMRQAMRAGSMRLARALKELEKPIVAAVNGPCAGAGAGLALASDFALAADDAVLSIIFIQRGLVPDYAVTYWLPRVVGLRAARRLALLGDKVGADEAAELGLVDRVVPAADLLDEAHVLARRLADGAGVALRLTKRLLNDSFDLDHATAQDREWTAQALCFASEDAREGAAAFLEKRQPQFRWR